VSFFFQRYLLAHVTDPLHRTSLCFSRPLLIIGPPAPAGPSPALDRITFDFTIRPENFSDGSQTLMCACSVIVFKGPTSRFCKLLERTKYLRTALYLPSTGGHSLLISSVFFFFLSSRPRCRREFFVVFISSS